MLLKPEHQQYTFSYKFADDEIIGVSVSIRDKDDLILVWNRFARLKDLSTAMSKIQELLPNVAFSTMFYKGKSIMLSFCSHV